MRSVAKGGPFLVTLALEATGAKLSQGSPPQRTIVELVIWSGGPHEQEGTWIRLTGVDSFLGTVDPRIPGVRFRKQNERRT
ncbi:hypothetical protein R1flu_029189 [Riccia fluitans]|uniref:Uncharacterized protein n=1 Tax=Riccia fluitans TaxID=41844 RepID=A0ABD1XRU1_9MARC